MAVSETISASASVRIMACSLEEWIVTTSVTHGLRADRPDFERETGGMVANANRMPISPHSRMPACPHARESG
jgi:hypothetical protein